MKGVVTTDDFAEFVAGQSSGLLRLAFLLTGDRGEAEDLLQSALERCYRRWARVRAADDPAAYARRVLVNLGLDRRRLRRFRTVAILDVDPADPADAVQALLLRDTLVRALLQLPPRQRAVVVLRYVEDLSEADTAAHLGCATGSVKSQASRGLGRLRELLGTPEPANGSTP